ncbi:putative porin [Melioribacter sp. Ez-97]|uniref:putative porin n=1 Tax=Melioribacter sp. Ez-97 TaxID=3423434 RepID=UPI003ED95C5A
MKILRTTIRILGLVIVSFVIIEGQTDSTLHKTGALIDSTGNSISKKYINFSDYRYPGDFFKLMPFGFLRDLGFTGQPHELILYGEGFNNISVLSDQAFLNDRIFNSFDLNLFQSESIEEIELIPLARGFLYGADNNPAAINFVSRKYLHERPYTRLRYYQAPYDEGFIDGYFNSNFSEKLNISFELTNQSAGLRYPNSDYSLWAFTLKTNYKLSDSTFAFSSYKYSKTNTQLNGGVNIDSAVASPLDYENPVIYNPILAPVNFYYRYQKSTLQYFDGGIKSYLDSNAPYKISFFLRSHLNEYRQNDTTYFITQTGVDTIIHDNSSNSAGLNYNQSLNFGAFRFYSINQFEYTSVSSPLIDEDKLTVLASSLIGSTKTLQEKLELSYFGKYLNYNGSSHLGYGADLSLRTPLGFIFYAGYSNFSKPYNLYEKSLFGESGKQIYHNAEIKLSYYSPLINAEASYFRKDIKNKLIMTESGFISKNILIDGANLRASLKLWKFLFETNSSYYFNREGRNSLGLPDIISTGGIYYVDTLFNNNLNLKTGFNFYLYGKRPGIYYDFERMITASWHIYKYDDYLFKPSNQIDFFFAGQLQERAILYFVFENLLNSKYFIVPYYPKQERAVRFGVAWEFFD